MQNLTNESDVRWLDARIAELTDEIIFKSPSEWAEENRYLPRSVTSEPGPFSYDSTPYLREIIDCLDVRSPIREVSLMKGAQLGWTTGVLENGIGYVIDVVKSEPSMFMTADAELAQMRLEQYITPMIQQSGLAEKIVSNDETNKRKQGMTQKKISWVGGGFLLPFGARNAAKMRSFSVKYFFQDENDGWPAEVGRDGDPQKLAESRMGGYFQVRKIFRGSTPLRKDTTRIEKSFLSGDQRYYFVKCLGCGQEQRLRFKGENDQRKFGLVWKLDGDGNLDRDSVRYRCEHCGHEHTNADKYKLFVSDNARWKPTAVPKSPAYRSYHLSALYSPAKMKSWADCVQDWLEAWDEENGRPRDNGLLQVFYNNVLGKPFKLQSQALKFETVSAHRRHQYGKGQVNNEFIREVTGSPLALVTCAVDIHKSHLEVSAIGWASGKRCFVIDEWSFTGDCENLESEPWNNLREILEKKTYTDKQGRQYPISMTLVDASWNTDTVVEFCSEYEAGVYAVMGKPVTGGRQRITEWQRFTTAAGTIGYTVFVDFFKDRWHTSLRHEWSGQGRQPIHHFNAPVDFPDSRLKELTKESKKKKINKETGQAEGWMWYRPHGSDNEMWDLLIYNTAALEIIAHNLMIDQMGREDIDWLEFWELCESGLYFVE